MTDVIVQTDTVLTLLGASPTQISHVKQAVTDSLILVAADGGAIASLAAGRMPDVVIGDMDSITPDIREEIPAKNLFPVAEQDSTDFEKCLTRVRAPLILAYGFLGGRLDHELAALTSLARFADQKVILIGDDDIVFLSPMALELDVAEGTRVSLYPMAPVSGTSSGLKYPIADLVLSPNTRVGTSNEATGQVQLTFDSANMLVILPVEFLAQAAAALAPELKSALAPVSQ